MTFESPKKEKVVPVSFNKEVNLFQLKINNHILESENASQFMIRKSELVSISSEILPVNIKFILHDETLDKVPKLINVKIIVIRNSPSEFWITIEESSQDSRWINQQNMFDYYNSRYELLSTRQKRRFDIIVQTHIIDRQFFFLQYTIVISRVNSQQIFALCLNAIETIHKSSQKFNE